MSSRAKPTNRTRAIRVLGLVSLANRARTAWADAAARPALSAHIRGVLQRIEADCRTAGLRLNQLPAPSRRAVEFLQTLADDTTGRRADDQHLASAPPALMLRGVAAESGPAESAPGESARAGRAPAREVVAALSGPAGLAGLQTRYRRLADRLALAAAVPGAQPPRHAELLFLHRHLLAQLRCRRAHGAVFSEAASRLVGWIELLAAPQRWDQLVLAVGRAHRCFGQALLAPCRLHAPILIRFLPCNVLYRWRVYRSRPLPCAGLGVDAAGQPVRFGTLVDLPAAMICFDPAYFSLLAQCAQGQRSARPLLTRRQHADDYSRLVRMLDAAPSALGEAARADPSRGAHHDLHEVFERVNQRMFAGAQPRPRLVWGRAMTRRKFGHYEPVSDTVMIAGALDQPQVPPYVLDHVMHHELLHKRLGCEQTATTSRYHTRAFREQERMFPEYAQAEAWLTRFSRQR